MSEARLARYAPPLPWWKRSRGVGGATPGAAPGAAPGTAAPRPRPRPRLPAPRRAASLAPRRAAPLLLQGGRLLRLMPARRQASARPRLQQPLTVTILLLWLHLLLLHYGWTDAPGAAPVELDPDAPASRALARAGALLGATEAVGGGPAAAVAAGAGGGTRGCCGSASGGGSCGGFVRSLIPRPSPTHLCAPHTH